MAPRSVRPRAFLGIVILHRASHRSAALFARCQVRKQGNEFEGKQCTTPGLYLRSSLAAADRPRTSPRSRPQGSPPRGPACPSRSSRSGRNPFSQTSLAAVVRDTNCSVQRRQGISWLFSVVMCNCCLPNRFSPRCRNKAFSTVTTTVYGSSVTLRLVSVIRNLPPCAYRPSWR